GLQLSLALLAHARHPHLPFVDRALLGRQFRKLVHGRPPEIGGMIMIVSPPRRRNSSAGDTCTPSTATMIDRETESFGPSSSAPIRGAGWRATRRRASSRSAPAATDKGSRAAPPAAARAWAKYSKVTCTSFIRAGSHLFRAGNGRRRAAPPPLGCASHAARSRLRCDARSLAARPSGRGSPRRVNSAAPPASSCAGRTPTADPRRPPA